MSVGSVNPLEWLFPPVALTHAAADTVATAATGKPAIVTPGSAVAKAQKAEAEQRTRLAEAQRLSESRTAADATPLSAADELESRRRRIASASEFLTGARRPTSTLADGGTLG